MEAYRISLTTGKTKNETTAQQTRLLDTLTGSTAREMQNAKTFMIP